MNKKSLTQINHQLSLWSLWLICFSSAAPIWDYDNSYDPAGGESYRREERRLAHLSFTTHVTWRYTNMDLSQILHFGRGNYLLL